MKLLAPFLFSAALAATVREAPAQGSTRSYEPASKAEAELARQAVKDTYPQQVRDSLTRFQSVLVVWPGVVRRVLPQASGDSLLLVLDHHYFDWKEDHGCQRALYFLSPRGEGPFTLTVPSSAARAPAFAGKPVVGALVIAYGVPTSIDTLDSLSAIRLSAKGANFIDAQWYLTNAFTYGRDFSDFKFLKFPECSR